MRTIVTCKLRLDGFRRDWRFELRDIGKGGNGAGRRCRIIDRVWRLRRGLGVGAVAEVRLRGYLVLERLLRHGVAGCNDLIAVSRMVWDVGCWLMLLVLC